MNVAYAWAPITKSEKQDDGTITVYGPAASSALDRDNQRLDATWLDAAMPRWLAEGGGVREQHDPKRAVGVGVGLSKGDDGAHYLTAKIVDPVAVKKIEHGVLRGFSVGIKNPKITMGKADAPNGLVTSGEVIEVSVCDRPANSECMFALAKADAAGDLTLIDDPQVVEKSETADTCGLPAELYDRLATPVKEALATLAAGGATVTAEAAKADSADEHVPVVVNVSVHAPVTVTAEPDFVDTFTNPAIIGTDPSGGLGKADTSAAGRRTAATAGAAMPDGGYPIKTKADLRKAIRAVGRGNADHSAIRKHIIKRAKALGLEAMVPKNWNADGSVKDATKAEGDEELTAKAEQVLRDVRALAPSLVKADDGGGTVDETDDAAAEGDGESSDIASAEQAIAVIAKLIISEAESLAAGNLNEACDIDLLLQAVRSLKWFKENEEYEARMAAEKSDAADQTSASTEEQQTVVDDQAAAGGEENDQTADAETGNASQSEAVTKADVAELVKAAVAEVTTASEERTKALEAELTKANAAIEEFRTLPALGGPALTRTAQQQAQAKNSDADRMRQEAQTLMTKADQVSDRDLRDGYRDRAKALLAKADA